MKVQYVGFFWRTSNCSRKLIASQKIIWPSKRSHQYLSIIDIDDNSTRNYRWMQLELKSMKGLGPQIGESFWLQSNSKQCHRSKLAMIANNDFIYELYIIMKLKGMTLALYVFIFMWILLHNWVLYPICRLPRRTPFQFSQFWQLDHLVLIMFAKSISILCYRSNRCFLVIIVNSFWPIAWIIYSTWTSVVVN